MTRQKLRVMLLYGGRSGEHEIALRSAASVFRHLDRTRFEVFLVGIDKQGKWHLQNSTKIGPNVDILSIDVIPPQIFLPPNPQSVGANGIDILAVGGAPSVGQIDVIFPVMHGPMCEDGTIQGLLELAQVPYVGSGVLASAAGMDKDVSKRLARDAHIPIIPYLTMKSQNWALHKNQWIQKIDQQLGYPVFVKPANLGSSLGVHKIKDASHLEAAIADAFNYDNKVLVERGRPVREIELAVLESLNSNEPPRVSIPGEIIPRHEFYSYEAKYLDENGAELVVPARLTSEQVATAQSMARLAFEAIECEGMARVDLFLDQKTNVFYFNELNTIPGFTSISMYPRLWEASGIGYQELLSILIDLAVQRHQKKSRLKRDYF
jgi:D-alanine-D-alanine ligase